MTSVLMILELLLFGATSVAISSELGAHIPPGGFDTVHAVSRSAVLNCEKTKDLVLLGTVTKIYPVAGLRKKWAVAVHVDRVVSGEFLGTAFTFTVHSPSMLGLRVRRAYIIKAKWVESGYVVDESALKEVSAGTKPPKSRS